METIYIYFFLNDDRHIIFSPSTTHLLRSNSVPRKYIILAEKYPHLGGKKNPWKADEN